MFTTVCKYLPSLTDTNALCQLGGGKLWPSRWRIALVLKCKLQTDVRSVASLGQNELDLIWVSQSNGRKNLKYFYQCCHFILNDKYFNTIIAFSIDGNAMQFNPMDDLRSHCTYITENTTIDLVYCFIYFVCLFSSKQHVLEAVYQPFIILTTSVLILHSSKWNTRRQK